MTETNLALLKSLAREYPNSAAAATEIINLQSILNLPKATEHFLTDALASAAAEALCDSVNRTIAEGLSLKPRFSPGYGDVPLSVQGPILRRLRADSTLGITLNEAFLMTPVKSVTAIAGILL